jgi:hypothetical protein
MTSPSNIPIDIAKKLIVIRDALVQENIAEAWHHLYSIADPEFESYTPWATLETLAAQNK